MSLPKIQWLVICVVTGMVIAPRVTASPVLNTKAATPDEIKEYVALRAEQYNVDPELADWIIKHESAYNKDTIGDKNYKCPSTGKITPSYGLWQLNLCYNNISKEEALDVDKSTLIAMGNLKKNPKLWSSVRHCQKFYKDCPHI